MDRALLLQRSRLFGHLDLHLTPQAASRMSPRAVIERLLLLAAQQRINTQKGEEPTLSFTVH